MACITRTITGYIEEWGTGNSYFTVFLLTNGDFLDKFDMATDSHEIRLELSACTHRLLGIENNTQSYLELISDLGLEIPSKWKKHWTPAEEWSYYSIDQGGSVEGLESYEELSSARFRKENYNAFPTRDLAEKGKNLSKLGRLILLWQYANDCLFEPVWNNKRSRKHYFYYSHNLERILVGDYFDFQDDILYFETAEQVEAFIKAYDKEIKNLLGVI